MADGSRFTEARQTAEEAAAVRRAGIAGVINYDGKALDEVDRLFRFQPENIALLLAIAEAVEQIPRHRVILKAPRGVAGRQWCATCDREWPCPTERARQQTDRWDDE